VQPDHPVLHRDAVDKRLLVVQEVRVGHPELVGHPVIQGQVQGDLGVGQTLVPPGLLEVHRQCVVLEGRRRMGEKREKKTRLLRGETAPRRCSTLRLEPTGFNIT